MTVGKAKSLIQKIIKFSYIKNTFNTIRFTSTTDQQEWNGKLTNTSAAFGVEDIQTGTILN